VYENGKALGPAHTVHVDIASSGRGRFSHYNGGSGQTLRFSASDNSNPRTNGRVYTYKIV
jgi:pectate lyase